MPQLSASIIILTYNNLDYTRQCVESVLEHTDRATYELILVDNASSDGTQAYLGELAENHPNVRILLNEKNEGFARGNNLGAEMAQGEAIVFLNNDTIVTRGWLPGLLNRLDDPGVGMVGPVTNSSGNETRIQVDYSDIEGMPEFARKLSEAQRGRTFEISMLAFLCVALRRAVYQEIGPLDERFGIGMFEDDDYALRLKAKGYKILCVEDVFVHHWGSASFSRLDATEFWSLFQRNLKLYEEKWGIRWLPHPFRLEFIPEQLRQMIDGLVSLSDRAGDYHQQVVGLQQLVSERDEYIADSVQKMDTLYAQVQERDQAIAEKNATIEKTWTMVLERDAYIAEIARSRAWRLVQWLWRVRLRLVPRGSWLERLIIALLRPLRAWRHYGSFGLLRAGLTRLAASRPVKAFGSLAGRLLPRRSREYFQAFRQEYPIYDRSQVTVFTSDEGILPDYPQRRPLTRKDGSERVKVSLISTVRNEATSVDGWLDSLLKQSRLPDELVISDGGSSDKTVELIRKRAEAFPIPIQLIEAPGANISRGRNIAIQHVNYEVIACADFGCELDRDWLQNLILPFESEAEIDVSCGFSQVQPGNEFSRIAGQYFVPDINKVNPQQFIPSGAQLCHAQTSVGAGWRLPGISNLCGGGYAICAERQAAEQALGIRAASDCLLAGADRLAPPLLHLLPLRAGRWRDGHVCLSVLDQGKRTGLELVQAHFGSGACDWIVFINRHLDPPTGRLGTGRVGAASRVIELAAQAAKIGQGTSGWNERRASCLADAGSDQPGTAAGFCGGRC